MQLYRPIALKTKLLLLFLIAMQVAVFAFENPVAQPPSFNGIKLIENKGQWPAAVLFKANIPGGDVFITSSGFVYHLLDEAAMHAVAHQDKTETVVKGHNYKMTFANGHSDITILKQNPSDEVYNYFIGNDEQKWAGNCRAYQTVILQNIYNGIDAEVIAKADFIKLNFIVHPYANPGDIQLVYEGMDRLMLKDQSLHIQTTVASVKEEKPVAFQEEIPVACQYILNEHTVQFKLDNYDKTRSLTIDPEIIFGTYSGSVADNFGFTGTYDEAGNGFAAGTVYSSGFPVTTGAFQLTFAGGSNNGTSARDIGVLKFSSDGKKLIYATYLGGSQNEQPHSLVCNAAGELYILGTTLSANFPTSLTAYDRTFNGNNDIIVSKLSADGTRLLASTYWGGTDHDGINGILNNLNSYRPVNPLTYNYGDFYRGEILLDNSGQVYVASTTQSSATESYNTTGGFQTVFGGGNQDAVLFSLSTNLSTLNFSTYLGGTGEDAAYGMRFDSQNNLILCGGSNSNNLPVTNSSFPYKGNVDGFIAKISLSTLALTELINVGTTSYDQIYFVDVDPSDHIYVTGQTLGAYPTKGSVYSNPDSKQFITIYNKNLDSVLYSTVIGSGSSEINISPSAFMVDKCGKVYLSGWGGNSNAQFNNTVGSTFGLTVTPDAFQSTTDGSDFYLIILSENLAQLKYATFMGGRFSADHVDGGTSRFDKKGMIYQSICAGCGGYSDLPVTPLCYSPTNKGKRPNSNAGGCNNALIKFNADPYNYPPMIKDTLLIVTATDTLNYHFTITNPIGDSVNVAFSGSLLSIANAPLITKSYHGKTANVSINWITLCNNASPDTFMITAETMANGCFGFRSETAIIKILVRFPPAIVPPFPNCLKTIDDSTIRISWTETNYGRYFKRLEVYKSIDGSPFSFLGQSLLETDTSFLDNHANDHLTTNICYYFVGINICDSISAFPSRYICSLYPYDSADHIFEAPRDTTIYITATDTLDYTFTAETINPLDSVFITATGSVLATNRVLAAIHKPNARKGTYQIIWRSICEDVTPPDTLSIRFLVRDNQCPQSRTKQSRLNIIVLPPPVFAPPVMKCTRSLGASTVLVRWEKPVINKRYFSHFVLLRRDANGMYEELTFAYHDSAFSYTDLTAVNNASDNICYSAYAVNVCDMHGDTGKPVCTVIKTTSQPAPLYIYTTTVVNNEYLNLQWARSTDNTFWKYRVLKKNAASDGDFTLLSDIEDINDTSINDRGTDVQKSVYCYQIRQVNDCGVENTDAYHACSILLQGKSTPFEHDLNWNDYDFWKNGLNKYFLLRQQPNLAEEEINRYAYKNTVAEDKHLNLDNGLYHYTIRAEERNSRFTSVSNTIELIQAPLLHVPNVFTANGDGLNDVWQPVPAFVKDFDLKIYNRWGQLVFQTTDKKQYFSGIFNGNTTTADVFVYLITYTGWDGSSHQVKGNVTQLK